MCLSVRFASSVAAAWSAGVAEHRFESQRNSRNVLSFTSFETTPQRSARFSGEYYSYIYIASKIELENWIYICEREREREREREDVCLYLRALRKSTNMTTQSFSTFHCEEEEVEEEDEDPLCRLVS